MKSRRYTSIAKRYAHVFFTDRRSIRTIMSCTEARYCNIGKYGWNCDMYTDDETGVIILAGIRNLKGKPIDRDVLRLYHARAKSIIDQSMRRPRTDYSKFREMLELNRKAFYRALAAQD